MGARRWVGKRGLDEEAPAVATASGESRETPEKSGGCGPRIAIVGTGIAALMCTRDLAKCAKAGSKAMKNAKITLFTSRGKFATQMGPRNQTPPQPGKPFFDYGCQYFTATETWFQDELARWASLGCVQTVEDGQLGTISEQEGFKPASGEKCWVGRGGMGPALELLIEDTAREFASVLKHIPGFPDQNMAVKGLKRKADGWELHNKDGKLLGEFDFVIGGFAQHVLTDPFLLSGGEPCAKMLQCLRRVESNQIIPIQVAFEGDPLPAGFTAAHVYGEECLSFISNNSKKPQKNGTLGTPGAEHWTLLSTAAFAEKEFNCNPKGYRRSAEQQMFSALCRVLKIPSLAKHRPAINRINHWEDGLAAKTPPNSRGCLFDVSSGLGWCGDFCVMPGVQGAATSGASMARTLAEFLAAQAATDAGESFDADGLLPCDEKWIPFEVPDESGVTLLDIGAFSSRLGLPPRYTHTNLVPSAVHGYDPAAHTGAAGQALGSAGKGGKGKKDQGEKGRKGGKGKGKSWYK